MKFIRGIWQSIRPRAVEKPSGQQPPLVPEQSHGNSGQEGATVRADESTPVLASDRAADLRGRIKAARKSVEAVHAANTAELERAVRECTIAHQAALHRLRRQTVTLDEFGKPEVKAWIEAIERFVERVVLQDVPMPVFNRWLRTDATLLNLEQVAIQARGAHAESTERALAKCMRPPRSDADSIPLGPIGKSLIWNRACEQVFRSVEETFADSEQEIEAFDGPSFEGMCAQILASRGWSVRCVGGSGDQGADVLAERDGCRCAFQCKFYSKPVGNDAVQEAASARAYHECTHAAVVSKSGFTKSAQRAAQANWVVLLDVSQLGEFDPSQLER